MSETIAKEAVALLREKCKTLAVAESCTGGSLCGTLTDVPGVSEVFRYGVAVYANEAKTRELSVPETLIAAHGAVSEEVAVAMAQGVRAKDHADLGLAVTGIAGPGGGTRKSRSVRSGWRFAVNTDALPANYSCPKRTAERRSVLKPYSRRCCFFARRSKQIKIFNYGNGLPQNRHHLTETSQPKGGAE